MDDYVSKPVKAKDLTDVIQGQVQGITKQFDPLQQ